jgi:hypothetical protein
MALRRTRKNARDLRLPIKRGLHGLDCKECGRFVDEVSADCNKVTCAICVQRMVEPPIPKKVPTVTLTPEGVPRKRGRPRKNPLATVVKKSAGWGRGWHLKKHFVAPDGSVYANGKLKKKG